MEYSDIKNKMEIERGSVGLFARKEKSREWQDGGQKRYKEASEYNLVAWYPIGSS